MISKKTYIPARPRSDKLTTVDKRKTFKSQIQNIEFELRKDIENYQLDNDGILDDSEKISLKLLQNEVQAKKLKWMSEVNSISNSIYLAGYHKDALLALSEPMLSTGGIIDTLVLRINEIILGDGTIPDDYKYRYEKALALYFDNIDPLELAITGARSAIEAEIKRRADSGSGEIPSGGENELREYDLRFDGKYWNNVGFIEIDMNTIQINKIKFLSDDQNSWTDEQGRRMIL